MKKFFLSNNILLVSSLILILFGVSFQCFHLEESSVSLNLNRNLDYNQDWFYIDEITQDKVFFSLPYNISAKSEDLVTIYKELPNRIPPDSYISFRSSDQAVKVSIDSHNIYENGWNSDLYYGKSPGAFYNVVAIPLYSEGKTISITIMSNFDKASGSFLEVIFGTKADVLFDIISKHYLDFIVSLIIILLGIILLIVYILLGVSNRNWDKAYYLAITTISFGLYFLSESNMLQFFTGNQVIISFLSYYFLMFIPIPTALFFRSLYERHHKDILLLLLKLFLFNIFISIILFSFEIADYIDIINLTIALILISIIIIIFCLFYEILKHNNDVAKKVTISIFVLLHIGFIDSISYILHIQSSYGKVTRYSYLLFAIFFIFYLANEVVNKQRLISEKEYYLKLAHTDSLTDLGNRAAFYNYLSSLDQPENIKLIIIDINNLKQINDKYGHKEGDYAIKTAAESIYNSFSEYGKAYRIGGDEFAVVTDTLPDEQINNICATINKSLTKTSAHKPYKLSIAHGFAKGRKGITFNELHHNADINMYTNKASMKS